MFQKTNKTKVKLLRTAPPKREHLGKDQKEIRDVGVWIYVGRGNLRF